MDYRPPKPVRYEDNPRAGKIKWRAVYDPIESATYLHSRAKLHLDKLQRRKKYLKRVYEHALDIVANFETATRKNGARIRKARTDLRKAKERLAQAQAAESSR